MQEWDNSFQPTNANKDFEDLLLIIKLYFWFIISAITLLIIKEETKVNDFRNPKRMSFDKKVIIKLKN